VSGVTVWRVHIRSMHYGPETNAPSPGSVSESGQLWPFIVFRIYMRSNKEDSKDFVDKHGRLIKRIPCKNPECIHFVSFRKDLVTSGLCQVCSRRKAPFIHNWKRLHSDWRELEVTITYEEYLDFTKIKECHYCDKPIPWHPHTSINNKHNGTYLDRKDNNIGYLKENCVVCCTRCNRMRSDKFSYEEFMLFSPVLKQIEKDRNK